MAEAFKIINSGTKFDIFSNLNDEQTSHIRKRIIHCVLATDMSFHTGQFAYLKLKIESLGISKGKNVNKLFDTENEKELAHAQKEVLNVILHSCDISNPAKPRDLSQRWLEMLCDEFFNQGDLERKQGLPISFMCDRHTVNIPNSQIGFLNGIIIPLFNAIVEFFPALEPFLECAKSNRDHFAKLKKEAELD